MAIYDKAGICGENAFIYEILRKTLERGNAFMVK